jgi:hypothetical protein
MIKNEVDFGFDNFGKQKILSNKDSIAQLFRNLLFLVPGQLPSLPHIGINITKYIYKLVDDINLENLREEIANQCSALLPQLDLKGISVQNIHYDNKDVMMIVIPLNIGGNDETLVMGLAENANGRIIFNYEFEDSITN